MHARADCRGHAMNVIKWVLPAIEHNTMAFESKKHQESGGVLAVAPSAFASRIMEFPIDFEKRNMQGLKECADPF